jgi:hypothetical protein
MVFTSNFWEKLFKLADVKLLRSSPFHPQMNGQSEVTNHITVMYLQCLADDRPCSWLQWLSWAEFCFNTSYQSTLHATPFEVMATGHLLCWPTCPEWLEWLRSTSSSMNVTPP